MVYGAPQCTPWVEKKFPDLDFEDTIPKEYILDPPKYPM